MIRNAGHMLEYLPPYSPELNPIEHKWAQAKAQRPGLKDEKQACPSMKSSQTKTGIKIESSDYNATVVKHDCIAGTLGLHRKARHHFRRQVDFECIGNGANGGNNIRGG